MKALALVALILLPLAGCGVVPGLGSSDPEIILTLPSPDCDCADNGDFMDRAFYALAEGEYLESLEHFQRYQRIEKTVTADIEVWIAIAFLSTLPDSPVFDREAAGESYRRVRRFMRGRELKLHGQILLMLEALETFVDMQGQLNRARQSNDSLEDELKKRESAIKRLRDLTLGHQSEPEDSPEN